MNVVPLYGSEVHVLAVDMVDWIRLVVLRVLSVDVVVDLIGEVGLVVEELLEDSVLACGVVVDVETELKTETSKT